jgi:integrase
MASLRAEAGKYFYGRVRDGQGRLQEFSTGILQSPGGVYSVSNRKVAQEVSELMEAHARDQISQTEFSQRLELAMSRVADGKELPTAANFIVRWAWEYGVTRRISRNRIWMVSKLADNLLEHLGAAAAKPLSEIKPGHFNSFILERRRRGYATMTVKLEIKLLRALGKAIAHQTGENAAAELQLEQESYEARAAYTETEVRQLLTHLQSLGEEEWQTLVLMIIYTGLRPGDAARMRHGDFDLEKGILKVQPGKTSRYSDAKPESKPLHRVLWEYLKELAKKHPHTPDDFLCEILANRCQGVRAGKFRDLCQGAGIDMIREPVATRCGTFARKTLYSLRHTLNVWLQAAGVPAEVRRKELGHRSRATLRFYDHPEDPAVLAARRQMINRVPALAGGGN